MFCTFASSFSFAVSFRSGLIVLRGGQRGFGGGQGIFRRGQGILCGGQVSCRGSLRVFGGCQFGGGGVQRVLRGGQVVLRRRQGSLGAVQLGLRVLQLLLGVAEVRLGGFQRCAAVAQAQCQRDDENQRDDGADHPAARLLLGGVSGLWHSNFLLRAVLLGNIPCYLQV